MKYSPDIVAPTRARIKQGGIRQLEGKYYSVNASNIDRYFNKGIITEDQFYAANRLLSDFIRAGIVSNASLDLSSFIPSSKGSSYRVDSITHSQVAARQQLERAQKAIKDSLTVKIVRDVCCYDENIFTLAKRYHCRNSNIRSTLAVGLQVLVGHYVYTA